MEQTALDESIRDIARGMIALGTDAKEAFESIRDAAERLAERTAALRAQIEVPPGAEWIPISEFWAGDYASVDLLLEERTWVTGWREPPLKSLRGSDEGLPSFWFWPTDDGQPPNLPSTARPRCVKPTKWRPALRGQVPFNGNYREQK